MSESFEPDPAIADRAKRVEQTLRIKLAPQHWIQLQSFTEDYLMGRGLLTLSKWRQAAEIIGVDDRALRNAFARTEE